DLSHVTSLELCIDTQEHTLGNFGVYLPKLIQLRMNNSVIKSVRDLGTTLYHLQVLWMTRCSLRDLSGIANFSSLKELYLAYNSVSQLSQVGMLENLQLLDLEGNDVADLVQVQYLALCAKLQTLILEGNPVCVRPNPTAAQTADYSYRAASAPTRSSFTARELPIHIPEHTYDTEELDGERADVLAELIAWREQHSSADADLSSSAKAQISSILASAAPTRPRTARAVLQTPPLHRALQPGRGSPQANPRWHLQ
ncbi:unnamed protein product, partial [Tetraodon nigroviridis]